MDKKPIQLESYHIHTGLTEAEIILLINNDFSAFISNCLYQLSEKKVLSFEFEKIVILEPFLSILKMQTNESVVLIEFAKQQVVLYAYEIPLLKLSLNPIYKNLLYKKAEIIQKVFYDWLEFRMIGYDIPATIAYYKNYLKK